MLNGNMVQQDGPAERPVYIKLLLMLGIGAAAGMVGYFVGKAVAGSLDFSLAQIAALLVGLVILAWAARDAVTRGAKAGKLVLQTIIGAVLAAGSVLGGLYLFEEPIKQMIETGAAWQMSAAIVALLYFIFGLILVPLGFRKTLPSGETLAEPERKQWQLICRWSALVTLAYSAAVIVLLVASMQTGNTAPLGIMGAILLAMLVQIGGTWMLWKVYDELWRSATKDACAISFGIFEVVLFLWAGASLAGLHVAFDPLGLVVVLSAIYLAATFFITFKRGMDEM
jgi:hypothetical protein